jgi:hypothetical protein
VGWGGAATGLVAPSGGHAAPAGAGSLRRGSHRAGSGAATRSGMGESEERNRERKEKKEEAVGPMSRKAKWSFRMAFNGEWMENGT